MTASNQLHMSLCVCASHVMSCICMSLCMSILYRSNYIHSHQPKYKIIEIYTVTERFCYFVFGYNYNEYIITSSGFLKYSMTKSSGLSQCDPELAIPDICLAWKNKKIISDYW